MSKWKLPDYLGGGELEGVDTPRDDFLIHLQIPDRSEVFALPRKLLTEIPDWPAGTLFLDRAGDAWIVAEDPTTATLVTLEGNTAGDGLRKPSIDYVRHTYGPLIRLVPETKEGS